MRTAADAPRLLELRIADAPEAWAQAGFTVESDLVELSGVGLRLIGPSDPDGPTGIVGWTLAGVAVDGDTLDGLPTQVADGGLDPSVARRAADRAAAPTAPGRASKATASTHANGCTGLDHVVVLTPDLDRTVAALEAAGLDLRRIRDTTSHGAPMRQAFFRLGSVILEVVSGDVGTGLPAAEAPATWFGLAVDVADLDETARCLGDGLGPIKGAVQPGRRIATLRHRDLGLSVAVAAMDDHADR